MEENLKNNKTNNEKLDEKCRKMQQVLSKISSNLGNVDLKNEYLIESSLKELGEKTDSSRTYIFLFKDNLEYMDNVYEWCAKGVSCEKNNLQNIKTEICPWWMKKLKANEIIVIEDMEKMLEEAELEKEVLEEQGIRSLIVLPMFHKDELIGYIGLDNTFENKNWNEESQYSLKLVSEIFLSAILRLQNEKKLKCVNEELSNQTKHINSLKAQINQQEEMLKISQSKDLLKPIGLNKENFNDIIKSVMGILNFDMMVFDKIELSLSEKLPLVLCNKIEISQVIMNILKNSIYEMNRKAVLLGKSQGENFSILKIETYEEEGYLICKISDNGMGFSKEVKDKLFEPFFSTKRLGEGTGLGLSIAYDIITNKHMGEIRGSESEWKGAKITIKLPVFQMQKL